MKNYLLLFLLVFALHSANCQDIIINTKNNTINCAIQKFDSDGISFLLPAQSDEYRIDWRNVKQVYYKNAWMELDDFKDSIMPVERLLDTAKIRREILSQSINKNNRYHYLEKAGNNLVLGTTLPIGGAIVGGGIIALSPDSEGARSVGYLILGGASLVGFICNISAGMNLIKAQRHIDYLLNNNTTGFKMGAMQHGIGIGYRF
jgi:hypothetical protein